MADHNLLSDVFLQKVIVPRVMVGNFSRSVVPGVCSVKQCGLQKLWDAHSLLETTTPGKWQLGLINMDYWDVSGNVGFTRNDVI
ncbi:hypothetical protein TNCT_126261 [Trichonephila clavata]|uniref:Uncharacterized protein n=1 Tax=Trichonephila clavata TaxID=2740835 RepID=A0A8X6M2C4_TRICU|nr:hypothetical protein TNCT_126261 [Trichonephila clavata]